VVHGIVERLRGRHPGAQLPGLLLREASHELPPRLVVSRRRGGLQVVGPARPPEEWRPPPGAIGPGTDGHGAATGPGARRRGGEGNTAW
jgi:hypothetical protein